MKRRKIGVASINRAETRWAIVNASPHRVGIPQLINEDVEKNGHIDPKGMTLREILEELSRLFDDCDQVAISCFGPFIPATPDAEGNGRPTISNLQSDLQAGGTDIAATFNSHRKRTGKPNIVPWVITDAAAAALGEYYTRFQRQDVPFKGKVDKTNSSGVYARKTLVALILGKGIGGGIVIGGQIPPFQYHPEMGHVPMLRMKGDTRPSSGCTFHKDCVTGLLARATLETKKSGVITKSGLEHFAFYAAQLCATVTYIVGPDAIALSGSMIRDYPEAVVLIKNQFREILRLRRAANDHAPLIAQERDSFQRDYISAADPRSPLVGTLIHALNFSRYAEILERTQKRNQTDDAGL